MRETEIEEKKTVIDSQAKQAQAVKLQMRKADSEDEQEWADIDHKVEKGLSDTSATIESQQKLKEKIEALLDKHKKKYNLVGKCK